MAQKQESGFIKSSVDLSVGNSVNSYSSNPQPISFEPSSTSPQGQEEKPRLQSASFQFTQDGNCVDGGYEELIIRCESSLGIDNDEGCFYVLETKQWAFDDVSSLKEIIDRISKAINK
jgi:hypothetical protein